MPGVIVRYVRFVEKLNYRVGRFAMYLLFALMGVLLYSTLSKVFMTPAIWTLEMAQFFMVAYFFLGGPYSIQMGSAVRMDLLYSNWGPKTRAAVDAFTVFFMLFYLGDLLWGGLESLNYSIGVGERSASPWRPYLWPIKTVICVALLLMILQATAEFFKNLARMRGSEI
jgi:TRAP-type mannitol/chloroaromatic compound transport system permease small subunit